MVDGERRFIAALTIGLEKIPVDIRVMDDDEAQEAQLISFVQRADITPLQEAEAFEKYASKRINMTNKGIGLKFGKTAQYIAQRRHLSKLIPNFQERLKKDDLSLTVALEICKLLPDQQRELSKDLESEKRAPSFERRMELYKRRMEILNNKIEQEVRIQMLAMVLKEIKSVKHEDLAIIVKFLFDGLSACDASGKDMNYNSGPDVTKLINNSTPAQLVRMCIGTIINKNEMIGDPTAQYGISDSTNLDELAKRYAINRKSIEKQVKEELFKDKEPKKPIKEEKLKSKKSKGVKKGTCRICGCTESKGCTLPNGDNCDWTDKTKTLCDTPDCLKAAKKEQKKKSPK
jgi:ParB-like chromosome segregation protein Spo0J